MAKLQEQSLEELYARPKITKAVQLAIISKSDFTKIDPKYCEKICKLKCKSPEKVDFWTREVDILIIQDHRDPPGKFDRKPGQQEETMAGVISFIAREAKFAEKGLTYKVLSLLKCQATNADFPSGTPPTQTNLQKCFPYLREEILKAKPKAIISLGTATTKALGLLKYSNTGNRGHIALSEYGPVVMTLHPKILTFIRQNARGAAGMWGPDYLRVIQRDFEKAAALATGEFKYTETTLKESLAKMSRENIRIARSLSEANALLDELFSLPPDRVVSFDTETTSLDVLSPSLKILTIQFGWRDTFGMIHAIVIPLWHRANSFYDPDLVWGRIAQWLQSDVPKVGHNAKYDILAIYWAKGVRVKNLIADTLLLLHSICSGAQGTYGLKSATWDYLYKLGIGGYEDSLGDLKNMQKKRDKDALTSAEEEQEEVPSDV